MDKFIFRNVITFKSFYAVFVAIPFTCLWGYLYYLLIGENFRLSIVMMFTGFCLGSCIIILKVMSSTIAIWFDDHYIYIQNGNKKFLKYLKKDIIGFYSYDYETQTPSLRSSLIKIKLYLKDEMIFYLNDIEYRNRYEEDKGNQLKKFLRTAQIELGFKKIKKKKFQNIYWYSKA